MKILFVCLHNPFLTKTGAHQRSKNIVDALSSFSDLDILIFDTLDEKEGIKEYNNVSYYNISDWYDMLGKQKRYQQFCRLLTPFSTNSVFPRNKDCEKIYKEKIAKKKYDFIFFRYINPYLMCNVQEARNILIDIDDLPWQNSLLISSDKSYSFAKRLYHYLKAKSVKKHGLRIVEKIDKSFFSNKYDCIYPNSIYLPNIPYIDCLKRIDKWQTKKNILFVGSLKHVPNVEGLDHFITTVWDDILKIHNDASLYIAGAGLSHSYRNKWSKKKSIYMLGFVEDLSKIYSECSIVIIPIYSGAGTNIKLLEALYMRKVCVVSSFAMRGFNDYFNNSESLFIVNDDKEFVDTLNKVLSEIVDLQEMANRGSVLVEKHFTLTNINKILYREINKS